MKPHDRKKEFFDHVWDHTTSEFLNKFTKRKELSKHELETMKKIICILCKNKNRDACDKIFQILSKEAQDSTIIPLILQLVGLTRTKILTDLKAMVGSQLPIPGKPQLLVRNNELLHHTEKYLTENLKRVFSNIIEQDCGIDDELLYTILEILNQATWSGFIRQERAKRSGHNAEQVLAQALDKLKIEFEPREKLHNPMSGDVQFEGVSYDMVIPNELDPKICFTSTVHTSNIGQFGETKDSSEIIGAKNSLVGFSLASKPVIVAFIDGIGLQSNIAGLESVLENADEFIQFKTMWKVAILAAHVMNYVVQIWLPDPDDHQDFLDKYRDSFELIERSDDLVPIGEGLIRIDPSTT